MSNRNKSCKLAIIKQQESAILSWDSYSLYWQMLYDSHHLLHQSFTVRWYCMQGHNMYLEGRNPHKGSLTVLSSQLCSKSRAFTSMRKVWKSAPPLAHIQPTRRCTKPCPCNTSATVLPAPALTQTLQRNLHLRQHKPCEGM